MTIPKYKCIPVVVVALTLAVSCPSRAQSAGKLFKQGQKAEESGAPSEAYDLYQSAHKLKPDEMKYIVALQNIRIAAASDFVRRGETLEIKGNLVMALVDYYKAVEIDPGYEVANQAVRTVQRKIRAKEPPQGGGVEAEEHEVVSLEPPPELAFSSSEPVTLHLTERSDLIFRAIGKLIGVDVLIDPGYIPKSISVDLTNVTGAQALRIAADLAGVFYKAVTPTTIFVAANERSKRIALEEHAVQVFYLSNDSQQNDINDIQTTLRNVMPTAKLYAVASQNAIVVNGTPDELLLTKSLIAALDKPKPEVMVDITVMEVSRDKLRELGFSPPTSLSVSVGTSNALNDIGRSSSYTFSLGQAAAEMLLTDSDTRVLQSPRLRATDGQKATLKIGERLPVATGSYTTTTTTSAVETQFQYIDVGVNVDMTPTIHNNGDVTLKLSVEVSSESGTETIDDVSEPIISQQKTDQTIRLMDGETSVLAGLVKKSISQSVSGWPGVGEIPGLKYLFTTQSHEVVDDELVFMIVPHVVRPHDVNMQDTHQIDTGSGTGVEVHNAKQ
jgi:general secretion pathway protein D